MKDLIVMKFLLLTPWLYILGFKGRLSTPFGKVIITNREKMKSAAYGAFKTHFCYLKDMEAIDPRKTFFPVVVDVGANVGDFTLAVASSSGKVIAIEPGRENFKSLVMNIAENDVKNVIPVQAAAHSCREALVLSGMDSMLHVIGSGLGEIAQGVPLDQVLEELGTEHVDVLKLDVQGHEEKVLRGMAGTLERKRIQLIVVEAHTSRGVRPYEIGNMMRSYGYRLVKTDKYIFGQPHMYFIADGRDETG